MLLIKRIFDLIGSLFLLVLLSPIILVNIALIKLLDHGPVFFEQCRVGRNGCYFNFYKFRTMVVGSDQTDGPITVKGDARITPLGRIQRKFKIDELPQLWNVLKGDMSFVGPRPDVPGYADKLEGAARKVLEMRPGITGPATLKYANEEKLLAQVDDPKRYNDEVLFPDKVRINLEYIDDWNLWTDLKILFKSVFRVNY